MRTDWRLGLIWACAVVRLLFYASMLPLWEGFDEWAHFAVVGAIAHGEWLPARDIRIGRDVEATLRTAPLPWTLRNLPLPSLSHDDFWRLSEQERSARLAEFRSIPRAWANAAGDLPAYETQQPPLYYWLMAPLLALLRGHPLAEQVMALRWFSALLASLAVPLTYAVAERAMGSRALGLGCAAVVSLMPGFAIAVARVGNDGIAVALFAALIWAGLQWIDTGRGAWRIGVILSLGLLTKAYFLTAIPAVAVLFLLRSGAWYGIAAAAPGIAWYARNVVLYGSLSGLTESSMPASGAGMWRHVFDVPWLKAIDSALFAHIYTGGWSMLTVRSWIYHVFYLAAAVALLGLLRVARQPRILWLIAIYGFYWAGALYDILLLFVTRGVATSMGYYLYAVVAAEVPLAVAGFRRWAAGVLAVMFCALDLYTVHAVDIPYYSGMIRHKAGNALAAVHWSDFQALGLRATFERLALFKGQFCSPGFLTVLWAAYLAATLALLSAALLFIHKIERRDVAC